MSEQSAALVEATVRQHCKTLHLPTIGTQFARLAAEAVKGKQGHTEYLEALLAAELEERERRTVERRIREAHLPKVKTLEDFEFSKAPTISAAQIRELAEGGYIDRAEPVVLTGDCGTGKTHLATALCIAACRQRRRVRFTTATALVNEFVEARHENRVSRLMARWFRYELVAVDEVGYVPLADVGAEFLYQVVSERAERAALIVTTNLSFSEWTQVFANPRLCKAMVDRVTDRAHIIETGKESYRFRRTLEARKKKARAGGRDGSHE
jgi:DNA replication protein DnaC